MYFLKNFSSAFFKRRYIYIYVCIIYIYAKAPNNTLIETSIFIIPTPNMKKLWETADTVQCSQLGPVLFLWCFGWRTTAPGVVSVSAVQQHDSAVPPSLLSLCPAPPRPSRHAPGWAACHTAASRQLWVSHEVVHTRQCCATRFAPPPSPPGRVQSAHVRLFCTLVEGRAYGRLQAGRRTLRTDLLSSRRCPSWGRPAGARAPPSAGAREPPQAPGLGLQSWGDAGRVGRETRRWGSACLFGLPRPPSWDSGQPGTAWPSPRESTSHSGRDAQCLWSPRSRGGLSWALKLPSYVYLCCGKLSRDP